MIQFSKRRSAESLVNMFSWALATRANAAVSRLVPTTGMVPGCEESRNFCGCLLRKCPAGLPVPPLDAYCFLPILLSLELPGLVLHLQTEMVAHKGQINLQ